MISECEYSDQQLVDNQSIRDTLCSFTLRHCRSVCCLLTACTLLQWRANQIPVVRVKEKSRTCQVHIMGCAKTGLPYMIFFLFYWLEGKKNRKAPAAFPADDITAPPAPSFLSHTQSLTLSLAVWLSLSPSDIRVASPGSQAVMFTDCISCQYPHKSTCPHHTHTCNRTPSLCDVYTCFFPIVLLLFVRSTQDAV